MKKIITLLCFIFVLTGCGSNISDEYSVKIKTMNNCDNKVKEYYRNDKQTIYLVCVKDVILKDDNKSISLKNYIKKNDANINNVIDDIIDKLIPKASLLTGEVTVYPDGGTLKYTNDLYTIVKCNTNNKDIYIGQKDLDLNEGFEHGFCGH